MATKEEVAGYHIDRLLSVLQEPAAGDPGCARVLMLDKDRATAEVLSAHLPAQDAEVIYADSVEVAHQWLAESPVALIVCNPEIAGENAPQFISELAEYAGAAGRPIVVIRRSEGGLSDVEMYLLGVDVILGPGVLRSELIAVVRAQLRKLAQQRKAVLKDPATGHLTLGVFKEAFARAASLAAREHESLTVVVLHTGGLDRLRRGGNAGQADEALRRVASGVADTLRQSDLLARGNGDTLLMLLPNTDVNGAERVIEKVHDRLQRSGFIEFAVGADLVLTAGMAEAAPKADFEATVETAFSRLEPMHSAIERALTGRDPVSQPARKRILIAEDDELTATIIAHRLERLGHEVVRVTDGAAALDLAPAGDLSLLILDVKMPYVDGFEALRRLRSIRAMRYLPIMLVTSMGNEEDIARGFELGADDYLVKPFSPIELQARVQRLIR